MSWLATYTWDTVSLSGPKSLAAKLLSFLSIGTKSSVTTRITSNVDIDLFVNAQLINVPVLHINAYLVVGHFFQCTKKFPVHKHQLDGRKWTNEARVQWQNETQF